MRRPGRIGPGVQRVVDLGGQVDRPALCDLEHRADAVDEADPAHRHRHLGPGGEPRRVAAAAEVARHRWVPRRRRERGIDLGRFDLPERLHRRLAVALHDARRVEGRRTGIDEVDDSAGGPAGQRLTRDCADRVRAPVRPDVGKDLGGVREQVAKEHRRPVEAVVLGRERVRRTDPVPVERRVQDRLREVAVGGVVRPLALALEPAQDRVPAERLLAMAKLRETRIADQEITSDQGHLDDGLPVAVLLLAGALVGRGVRVPALGTARPRPREGATVFLRVKDAFVDPPGQLAHVDRLDTHPEVALEEAVVDDRAGDAHRNVAEREVGLAAHRCDGEAGPGKAQQLLGDVRRNRPVGRLLDVAPVDAERRDSLLGMRREDRGEVDGARSLGPVEPPDSFRSQRVHVHRLGAVAPARGDGDRDAHSGAGELVCGSRCFDHAADRVVRDHALHRCPVRVAQILRQQGRSRAGHRHRLVFEGLADSAPPPIDGRPDSDLRPGTDEAIGGLVVEHDSSPVGCRRRTSSGPGCGSRLWFKGRSGPGRPSRR